MVRLTEVTIVQAPIERCFDLARSVEVHLAGNIHSGEVAAAVAGLTSGLMGLGQRVTWRAKHFGVWHELTSEITSMDRPVYFQDTMIRGPFRSMRHHHFFRRLSADRTEMKNLFCVQAPFAFLGQLAEIVILRRYMRTLLHERNAVVRSIAESSDWRAYLPWQPEGETSHENCHTRR
jgi:ligand-binding SRPBCC domain-containing protein